MRMSALSIDWDVQYHYVTNDVLDYDSWKYLVEKPAGKSDRVILEMKYLQGGVPGWFHELQQRHPIQRREYFETYWKVWDFCFKGHSDIIEKQIIFSR